MLVPHVSLPFHILRQTSGSPSHSDHHVLGRNLSRRPVRGHAERSVLFVGLRFATAAIAVGLLSLKTLRGLTLKELKAGVAIGVAIAMGYSLQTWGLQTITSSKSAFITAMYVPLVPLLQWLCLGRIPGLMSCTGIVLAFIGLILLAGPENNLLALGPGEIITLVGAIAIAAEIILISAWAGKVDVKRVTVVQLATASLVALPPWCRQGSLFRRCPPGWLWWRWGWASLAPLFRSP